MLKEIREEAVEHLPLAFRIQTENSNSSYQAATRCFRVMCKMGSFNQSSSLTFGLLKS